MTSVNTNRKSLKMVALSVAVAVVASVGVTQAKGPGGGSHSNFKSGGFSRSMSSKSGFKSSSLKFNANNSARISKSLSSANKFKSNGLGNLNSMKSKNNHSHNKHNSGFCKHPHFPCPSGHCCWRPYPIYWPYPVYYGGTNVVQVVERPIVTRTVDLQLSDIALVDAGDLAAKRGPMYRVWVKNVGDAAVERGFDIGLIAATGDAPAKDSPFAVKRIEAIGAGEEAEVEIRLPFQALAMGSDAAAPFANLFAAVDVKREISETNEENNGSKMAREEIQRAATSELAGE